MVSREELLMLIGQREELIYELGNQFNKLSNERNQLEAEKKELELEVSLLRERVTELTNGLDNPNNRD